MGGVTRSKRTGSTLLLEGQSIEMLGPGNIESGQDGNLRMIIVNGKILNQRLDNQTWVTLKSIS